MLQDILNEAIAQDRKKDRKSSGKFSVSDAGRCHLMRYRKRKRVGGEEPDARAFRVFEVGHIFERWIADRLRDKGLILMEQAVVEDEHRKGILDAVVQAEDKAVLYDFKTVHSRKFWHNNKQGWDADVHYRHQILTYWDMLGMLQLECRLAYISKDDLCIEEIGVPTSGIDEVREHWEGLITAWEKDTEPEANPLDWECKYCIYGGTCDKKPKNAS